MEISVKRCIFTSVSTISDVMVDGIKICHILEDTVRPKGEKVWGKTAIPSGRYQVIIDRSKRFSKAAGKDVYLPLLVDVPGYAGVRLHPGNDASASSGCLLPGLTVAKDFVGHSKAAFATLFALIQGALSRHEKVWLTIS